MARIKLDRDLQRYADQLCDKVEDIIRNFEDNRNDTIHNAARDIKMDKCTQVAALVFEALVFDDDVNERDAIEDAAEDAVQASLYTIIKNDYRLSDIDRDDEDDFRASYKDVEEILSAEDDRRGSSRGRGRDRGTRDTAGRSRDRNSGRDRRTNNRRDNDRDDNKSRRSRHDRDEDSGRQERDRQERDRRRNGENADRERDEKVQRDQDVIEEGKSVILTGANYKAMGEKWKHKDVNLFTHAPIYFAATQSLVYQNGSIYTEPKAVEKEVHRTDIYLQSRTEVKPTGSIRKEAFEMALRAREVFVKDLVDQHNEENNAVTGDVHYIRETIFTRETMFLAYGKTDPKVTLEQALEAYKLRGIPKAPVIYQFERTPTWVLTQQIAIAIRNLAGVKRFSDLITKLIDVASACIDHPAIWAHIHDVVTKIVCREINLGIGVNLTMASVVTDWNNLSKWLSEYHKGVHISYLDNIIGRVLTREFRVRDHDEPGLKHMMVDGTPGKYAALYHTEVAIHLPEGSEHLDIASPTRLGRVYESMTPELFRILSTFNNDEAATYFISTGSGDMLYVYGTITGMERAFYIDIA